MKSFNSSTDPLLAKSKPPLTLLQHTKDVVEAARALFGNEGPTRLGKRWLAFFKLSDSVWPRFTRSLQLSAWLHDLGKASDDFQQAVRGSHAGQLLRHEHLSALILSQPDYWAWLTQLSEIDAEVVRSAVVCHHLKSDSQESAKEEFGKLGRVTAAALLHSNHSDFLQLQAQLRAAMQAPCEPPTPPTRWQQDGSQGVDLLAAIQQVRRSLNHFGRSLKRDLPRAQLLAAVRAGLIVADSAGSGLRRQNHSIQDWVQEQFDEKKLLNRAKIYQQVIEPRIQQINQQPQSQGKQPTFTWSPFQNETGTLPERALLQAPCGTGKTLAAWQWLANQAELGQVRHVLFLYPTRATATEGFRDYVSWAPEATLLHGTSQYDLEGMFENPNDERTGRNYEAEARLFAIGLWSKQVFSATVDQFFAFLQYHYASVCLLPILADAAVIVDEVHSFDKSMFEALLQLLQQLHVPVLCMTATLPPQRRERLVQEAKLHLLRATDSSDQRLTTAASASRYRLQQIDETTALQVCQQAISEKKRILWVVNTVQRAQNLYRQVEAWQLPDLILECYHSRFRLCDRRTRHEEVVRLFHRANIHTDGPVLAITTQVCEMGLDLDSDVLITEQCPATSLVQRMGRCNRQLKPRPNAGEIYLYPTASVLPYTDTDLAHLQIFLDTLDQSKSEFSQVDLEAALEQLPGQYTANPACQFFQSGAFAAAGIAQFRDIESFTTAAVLHSDLQSVLQRRQQREPIDGFVVPAPWGLVRDTKTPAGLPDYLRVVPEGHYSEQIGLTFEKQEGEPTCPPPPSSLII